MGIPSRRKPAAWTPEQVALLGTLRDAEIARRLGRKQTDVAMRRRARGLSQPPKPQERPWTAEELQWLGVLPDAEVARRSARPASAVAFERRARGIRAPKAPSPTPGEMFGAGGSGA